MPVEFYERGCEGMEEKIENKLYELRVIILCISLYFYFNPKIKPLVVDVAEFFIVMRMTSLILGKFIEYCIDIKNKM